MKISIGAGIVIAGLSISAVIAEYIGGSTLTFFIILIYVILCLPDPEMGGKK